MGDLRPRTHHPCSSSALQLQLKPKCSRTGGWPHKSDVFFAHVAMETSLHTMSDTSGRSLAFKSEAFLEALKGNKLEFIVLRNSSALNKWQKLSEAADVRRFKTFSCVILKKRFLPHPNLKAREDDFLLLVCRTGGDKNHALVLPV